MKDVPNGDPLLETVRVDDVKSYLLNKGWVLKPFARPQTLYFEGPPADDGEPIVQLVPASERFRDYRTRIEDLLRALSVIEDRPANVILREIVAPDCDRVTFRLESAETRTGAVGLDCGVRFIEEIRNLLLFTARGVLAPRQSYGPFDCADPFDGSVRTDRWRLRPVAAAGFALAVEVPLTAPGLPERKMTAGLVDALGLLREAVAGGARPAVGPVPPQINANMCEALVGMLRCTSDADARLEVVVSWSPSWPAPGNPPRPIVFEGRAADLLHDLATALRGRSDHPADLTRR
jgi:hypothetical protein